MLNEKLDWEALRKSFNGNGWIVVNDILQPEFANAIGQALEHEVSWDLFYTKFKSGNPNIPFPEELATYRASDFLSLSAVERAEIANELIQRARKYYAFYYYKHDLIETDINILKEFYDVIGSEMYYGFIRYITNELNINKRNAIATCYQPGCFLKQHNDAAPEENRRVAHVFGFTRGWQAHWGGILHMLDDSENVTNSLLPRFNTLTLFSVPHEHFVSQVANFAPANRYSITGWFTATRI
jgi:Rps23 Pro-64 3,4-dihydroxylase Tpa1-like proline 4-hydroxylase